VKPPQRQQKHPEAPSTKAYVYTEFHPNRLEVGLVIPSDVLDVLDEGGLQSLINAITRELLQATLSLKENEAGKVC